MSQNVSPEFNEPNTAWTRLLALTQPADHAAIEAAYDLARRAHDGQWRRVASDASPLPYIVHPLRVACLVAGEWQRSDRRTMLTALLHDVLEDVPRNECQDWARRILDSAGREVLEAVWTLTKPDPSPAEVRAARDARYFSELRSAPEWVRLIKCADRVDNLRDARAWGDVAFWERYSSETLGWHLYLARETAAIAEVALFSELVAGERDIRGRVPVWADGHLVDPAAATIIPEHVARHAQAVGLARRGDTLIVGMLEPEDARLLEALRLTTQKEIAPVRISADALHDVLAAGLFGDPARADVPTGQPD